MLTVPILKRYLPNASDWLIGGMFLVIVLWLIVLPIEILQAITHQDFLRPSLSGWIIRSFYIVGYGTSLALISPLTNPFLTISRLRLVVVIVGLLISSPLYFLLGALLSARRASKVTLGVLLLIIKVILGCFAIVAVMVAD